MVEFAERILKSSLFKYIVIAIATSYAAFRLLYYSQLPLASGDSGLFAENAKQLLEGEVTLTNNNGFSFFYHLLSLPLAYFFGTFEGNRIFNVVLAVVFVGYAFANCKSLYSRILWSLPFFTAATLDVGTNDLLFQFFLFIGLHRLYLAIDSKEKLSGFGLTALVAAICIRPLFVMYIPVLVVLFGFFFWNRLKFTKRDVLSASSLLVFFCVVNCVSLFNKGKLLYDNKEPDPKLGVNWIERQYLSQLAVNEGKIPNYTHVSWEEVNHYKKENGENSLPKTLIQAVTFDLRLTLLEGVKDFLYILKDGTRQTGLTLLLVLLFPIFSLRKSDFFHRNILSFTVLVGVLTFAVVIISFVEMRWLVPLMLLASIHFESVVRKNFSKQAALLILTNVLFGSLIAFYGNWNILKQFFLT